MRWGKRIESIKEEIKETIKNLISENLFSEPEIQRLLSDKDFCYRMFGCSYPALFPSSVFKLDYCNYHIFTDWTDAQFQRFIKWRENIKTIKEEIHETIKKLFSENLFSKEEIQRLLSDTKCCYKLFRSSYAILFSSSLEIDYCHIFTNWTEEQYQRFIEWKKGFRLKDFSEVNVLFEKAITISRSIKVGEFRFLNLESVIIREPSKSIGTEAFFSCYNLSFVKIPSSVTYIGKRAFSNCSKDLIIFFDSPSYWLVSHSSAKGESFDRIFLSKEIPCKYLDCYLFKEDGI